MTISLPIIALAFALAADALAVALIQGARFRPGWRQVCALALVFGVLQGLMPLIGLALGSVAFGYATQAAPWIAFGLLVWIGLQMILAASAHDGPVARLNGATLLMAGLATSIDALAAGISLPSLTSAPAVACAVIAFVTFLLSALGVKLGAIVGDRFGNVAEICGGIILIVLGTKILADHLGYL